MMHFPNILLVAGQGRNVGKTSLIVSIIQQFKNEGIVAIKISPHFHVLPPEARILSSSPGFQIVEELEPASKKDSSRFLKAGAERVFYMQVLDEHLADAFAASLSFIDPGIPLIVESGGLGKFLQAGLFLFVESNESSAKNNNLCAKADKVLRFRDGGFDFGNDTIKWDGRSWKLKAK